MNGPSGRLNNYLALFVSLLVITLSSCSAINPLPPEVNLMRVDVQEVTLSHVNLLADLRVFNPNATGFTVQGVDYTLKIEGIEIFSGKSRMRQIIAPQEYSHLTLRLSSAYWDIIQLLNKLPNTSDVAFVMQGSILIGGNRYLTQRFSFDKQGIIPFQKTGL